MSKAIIFDVDGTLLETEETHGKAFNRAFAEADCHDFQEIWRLTSPAG